MEDKKCHNGRQIVRTVLEQKVSDLSTTRKFSVNSMNYGLLGRSGLRVSELCLGTMTLGTEWGWGGDVETSRAIFNAFGNAGGNFIDTANRYTEGSGERMLWDFVSSDRSYWVLATKFTLFEKRGDVNGSGNHRKNLRQSLAASLKRLPTDYVNLLWVHSWDFTVQPDELMRSLEDVVRSGQALHLGVSDTPAWIIAQANTLAAMRRWEPFTAVQVEYNLIERSAEGEQLPMAKAFGLAFSPWAPLAGGALTGKYLQPSAEQKRLSPRSKRVTGRNIDIAAAVVDAARELGWSPAQVARVWCRQREETVVPIAGARKLEQMHDILGAEGKMIPQEIKLKQDEISKIDLGFPHEFLQSDAVKDMISSGTFSKIVR